MNEVLGNRIRVIRESQNITQESVAEKLSMSRQRYARIEKGVNDISYDFILKVSSILGVNSNEITCAVKVSDPRKVEFRNPAGTQPTFDTISNMLDLFYANKRLYDQFKRGEE